MSGLADRVLEKMRGRPKSIKQNGHYDGRQSNEFNETRQDNYNNGTDPRMSSSTGPAWHVHQATRQSSDMRDDARRPVTGSQRYDDVSRMQTNESSQLSSPHRHTHSTASDSVPARSSSIQQPQNTNDYRTTDTQPQTAVAYPYTVPRRKESLPTNKLPKRTSLDQSRQQQKGNTGDMASNQQSYHNFSLPQDAQDNTRGSLELPKQHAGGNLGTEIDQALESLTVEEQTYQQTHGRTASGGQYNEHLRLPKGFNLGYSEKTSIDTEWKPAVTHENIHHQRTEIFQEAITRDIHVHHYYTYLQPIKVVEVLPPRHFRIDERTGQKIEISPPAGWVMPSDLRTRVDETSNVKGWSRHYLVNEQYPNGIPEPAPERAVQQQNSRQASHYANGLE